MILILHILDFENRNHTKFQFNWSISFRCGAGGSMRACHAACPDSIPVGTNFLGEDFTGFSPWAARQVN